MTLDICHVACSVELLLRHLVCNSSAVTGVIPQSPQLLA